MKKARIFAVSSLTSLCFIAYSTKNAARPATPAKPWAATVAIGEPAPGADVDAAAPAELVALFRADDADERAEDAELTA
jgi:hypothetical protein